MPIRSPRKAASGAPKARKQPLKVLYIASEASPIAKTGGLADVSHALPKALRAQGLDVRLAIPMYACIPPECRGEAVATCVADMGWSTAYGALRESTLPGTDVPLYLVEHDGYFDRPHLYGPPEGEYWDNVERFSFFNLAVLNGVLQTGWMPDVVHCHDWHAAPTVAYLKTRLRAHPVWGRTPCLFTIHNLGYQGRYGAILLPKTGLGWELFHPGCLEYYGDINLMKAAIVFADKVSTVSRTYALEIQTPEFGSGLDGILRTRSHDLCGIVNGVDYEHWNPAADHRIAAPFTAENTEGKGLCKRDLQRMCDLPTRDVPLFGMVTRLAWQKGVDLLGGMVDALLEKDVQLVALASGEPGYESWLNDLSRRHRSKVHALIGYDDVLAHRIYAGSDFFLMPSHTEPCGLSQLYSMAYGSLPIVRRTGGLADTVRPATHENIVKGRATGFQFSAATSTAFWHAVQRALEVFEDKSAMEAMRRAAMAEDFSWAHASKAYIQLYKKMLGKA